MAAIPDPRTWALDDPLTVARMNDIRDALRAALSPPRCLVSRSANLSVANNAGTVVTWDVELADTDGMHANVNTERITFQRVGLWAVFVSLRYLDNNAGYRHADIYHNVGGVDAVVASAMSPGGIATRGGGVGRYTEISVGAVGEYVYVNTWQNSGGALNLLSQGSRFGAHLISASNVTPV